MKKSTKNKIANVEKIIVVILSVFILLIAVSPLVSADDTLWDKILDFFGFSDNDGQLELTEEHGLYQVYEDDDGNSVMMMTPSDMKYYDTSTEEYEKVDTTIKPTTESNYDYKVDKGYYKAYLSKDILGADSVKIKDGDNYISFGNFEVIQHIGDTETKLTKSLSTQDSSNDNNIKYDNVYDGIDVEYQYNYNEFKENIYINSFEDFGLDKKTLNTSNTYIELSWDINTNTDIYNYLENPYIEDAKGVKYYDNYFTTAKGDRLYMTLSSKMLSELTYPILIDPSLSVTSATNLGGVLNYDSIFINATVTIPQFNGSSNSGTLWLNATYNVTINGTTINGATYGFPGAIENVENEKGYNGTGYNGTAFYQFEDHINHTTCYGKYGTWGADEGGSTNSGGSGASLFTNGSGANYDTSVAGSYVGAGAKGYSSYYNRTNLSYSMGCGGGSGGATAGAQGGAGGNGGAGLKITARNYINITSSTISVYGGDASRGNKGSCGTAHPGSGGAGAGGTIIVNTTLLNIDGSTFNAYGGKGINGDTGSPCYARGNAGPGGEVYFSYGNLSNASTVTNVSGGSCSTGTYPNCPSGTSGNVYYNKWTGNVIPKNVVPLNNAYYNTTTINITCNASTDMGTLNKIGYVAYLSNGSILFNESVANKTGAYNQASWLKTFTNYGLYYYNCYAGNSVGAYGSSGTNYNFFYSPFANLTITYGSSTNSTSVGSIMTFYMQLILQNITTSYPNSNATFILNGVTYNDASKVMSSSNNNTWYKNLYITDSLSNGTGKINYWNWSYNIFNTSVIYPTNYTPTRNFTSYSLDMDNCSTLTQRVMNISMYDEETLDPNNFTNPSIEAYLYIYNPSNTTTQWNFTEFTNSTNLSICMPSSVLNSTTLKFDSVVKYTADNHVTEYYFVDNQDLNNGTFLNITLYSLDNWASTSFIVNYLNDEYVAEENVIIDLMRFYVFDGSWKDVEWGKTDQDGNTILHLVTEDAIYKLFVRKDGSTQYVTDDFRALCQTLPCQINIKQDDNRNILQDFNQIDNFEYTFSFNETQRQIVFTYFTDDGSNVYTGVNVTKWDAYVNSTTCHQENYASAGTITCNIPSTATNTTYITDIYLNGNKILQRFSSVGDSPSMIFGSTGAIMTGMIFLTMSLIGMALGSGIAVISFGIIGIVVCSLLMLFSTGSIIGAGSSIMWLIVAGVIIIIKISGRKNN